MTVPLELHAIVWWDEHHKKCILGPVCKRETRIWQDAAGVPTKPEDGGVLPDKKRKTSAKFVQEARVCFGVAVLRNAEGYDGVKAAPFNYSGRTVVGVKNFRSRCLEEMRRVKPLKGPWGQPGDGTLKGILLHLISWQKYVLRSAKAIVASQILWITL